jgi:chromosome segregation ATPase
VSMLHNLSLLDMELQESVKEMRASGMPEDAIDRWVRRMFGALESKTNRIQADVFNIEEHWDERLQKGFDKLSGDLHTQHGATNEMLSQLLNGQQNQESATATLRAEFHTGMRALGERISENAARLADIERWQPRVDTELGSFRQSRDESKAQRMRTEQAVAELTRQFTALVAHIDQLIAQDAGQAQAYRTLLDTLMRERGGNAE